MGYAKEGCCSSCCGARLLPRAGDRPVVSCSGTHTIRSNPGINYEVNTLLSALSEREMYLRVDRIWGRIGWLSTANLLVNVQPITASLAPQGCSNEVVGIQNYHTAIDGFYFFHFRQFDFEPSGLDDRQLARLRHCLLEPTMTCSKRKAAAGIGTASVQQLDEGKRILDRIIYSTSHRMEG